jgi:hypothetical protein
MLHIAGDHQDRPYLSMPDIDDIAHAASATRKMVALLLFVVPLWRHNTKTPGHQDTKINNSL